jgi:hypothetical protein
MGPEADDTNSSLLTQVLFRSDVELAIKWYEDDRKEETSQEQGCQHLMYHDNFSPPLIAPAYNFSAFSIMIQSAVDKTVIYGHIVKILFFAYKSHLCQTKI